MTETEKKFIFEDGVCFEVTSYGLVCCLKKNDHQKHPCPDCNFCQWCSDSRCSLCRDQGRYNREHE